jgi:hypothetical protein
MKQLTKIVGLTAMAALAVGLAAAPANATPVPPTASNALLGTWINTNANSNSVKQVVVSPTRIGNVTVDAFGACSPTLCEWGKVPAVIYGSNVSSTTGVTFQTDQRFLSGGTEWSRTTLFGRVVRTEAGLRLRLQELTVFEDGSGRKNYRVDETFAPGKGQAPAIVGNSVSSYRLGDRPALAPGAFGSWVPVSPSGGLAGINITGTTAAPIVNALGQCSPTPCDWGKVRGITYGASISALRGRTVLAPYVFGFKNAQLGITFGHSATGKPILKVAEYNEFTDGSGRSNYVKYETFVRS